MHETLNQKIAPPTSIFKVQTKGLYQSLQERFYAEIPFPIDPTLVSKAIEAFFKFLNLPEEIKSYIQFSIAPKHRRGDVGYKHRNAEDHIYDDNKDFFHYHPAIFEEYASFLEEQPIVKNFMLLAKPIWQYVYDTLKEILACFEPQFPGVSAKIFNGKREHILLRFLKYEWENAGEYLAKPHFDAGSFTLAIAESALGLRIGSCPENLRLINTRAGHAIFMLSSNFRQVIDSTQFSAGWHDVIQIDETQIGKPFARWAVVAFIEALDVEALPRSETHKWYQGESSPVTF